MMNLGTLFKRVDDQLRLDLDQLRKVTDDEFVQHLLSALPGGDGVITEMKVPTIPQRKIRNMYFEIAGTWYAFTWDNRDKTLHIHKQLGQWNSKKWEYIVGHKQLSL